MIKNPHLLWVTGSIVSLITILLLFLIIPEYVINKAEWVIYPPGFSLPEHFDHLSITNIDILIRIGICITIYWIVFSVIYFFIKKSTDFELPNKIILLHFILTVLAFMLVIPMNKFITSRTLVSLTDLYVNSQITPTTLHGLEMNWILKCSLTTVTSIAGIILLIIGLILLVWNLLKSEKS